MTHDFQLRFIDQLIRFDYKLRSAFVSLSRSVLFSPLKNSPRRILVFRTGSIGDTVCALPALNAIRRHFSDSEMDLLTHSGAQSHIGLASLLEPGSIGRVIDYLAKSKWETFKQIRDQRYDLAIELPQYDASVTTLLRNQLIFRMAGIRSAFGWELSQTILFKRRQEATRSFKNERSRLLDILHRSGIPRVSEIPELEISDSIRAQTDRLLIEAGLNADHGALGMAIGSKLDKNKWPLEYFEIVAKNFSSRGRPVFVFGGPEDFGAAEKITNSGTNIFNWCGRATPLQSAHMMRFCSVVICNDSGPMHLAYSVGVPVIALFSSREYPGKWYPPASEKNVVFRDMSVPCSMCLLRACDNNVCLTGTKPERVIAAANLLLERSSKKP